MGFSVLAIEKNCNSSENGPNLLLQPGFFLKGGREGETERERERVEIIVFGN